jgi:hypothetical protein
MKTVWILTEEYNQYDQYGEYYRAAFQNKPTVDQLMKFEMNEQTALHVQKGGGRIDTEDQWYHLREEAVI